MANADSDIPWTSREVAEARHIQRTGGDLDQAIRLLEESIEAGVAYAPYQLAHWYETGVVGEPDLDKARSLYLRAMTLEHAEHQRDLSSYFSGRKSPAPGLVDLEIPWLERAADLGDAMAISSLADRYQLGDGVSQDKAYALQLYHDAADRGCDFAMKALGDHYYFLADVPEPEKAARYYRLLADDGESNWTAYAMNYLGEMYEDGCGVPKSHTKARDWFLQAAHRQCWTAAVNLGVLLCQPQLSDIYDPAIAFEWFSKAADRSSDSDTIASARWNLGGCYVDGEGVAKDEQQAAAEQFYLASELGHARSCGELSQLAAEGIFPSQLEETPEYWLAKEREIQASLGQDDSG